MFSRAAVTFIRTLPGKGATLRSLLRNDASVSLPRSRKSPEILTCAVDSDFICLKEAEETGIICLSDETKCCIASLMVVVGGDVNRDMFH
ncbi:hypothetical protein ABID21_004546 [Pseudorhizobium tarimense]|uniref:Uncharacterized protein n=1 Tax=Pseudorhizobium tarimense TaxID=1079109 RepID=A0ABV2HCY4_9HYPH